MITACDAYAFTENVIEQNTWDLAPNSQHIFEQHTNQLVCSTKRKNLSISFNTLLVAYKVKYFCGQSLNHHKLSK
jgi:predicted lipase